MRFFLTLGLAVLIGDSALAAIGSGDAVAGGASARHLCSNCHDVSGRARQQNPPGGAPAFVAVAQSKEMTAESLRRFLLIPHGRMVNMNLTGQEIDNLVGYILSLRQQ